MNTQTPAESLFYQALELSSEELSAFLDKACSADPALRAEVEELLQAYGKSDGFLTQDGALAGLNLPVGCASWRQQNPQKVGERIGPYKLMEQIGEGGFGTVWVAEQEHPIRRRVALKIIKLGMDTKEVVARFEQERQALALMDHPNIAKVLDAGATPTGRPFFVMELVTGIKITDYCDEARLATRERLKLFIQVCSAVQHAHQKGIIHRDLKPSNILVTLHDGIPVPKVIDFGVAKATQQQRLTDLTIYTQFEQMVGTPLYMAPEQAEMSGLDIDTRSDIYSLGVLLYELLAGRTPFDPEALMRRGLDEIRRVIREEEPQKPSTFVSTMALELRANVAKHRNLEGAKLISSIKGDLDWIVMKALEKDRNRRYETASSFAQDIERHLSSEPVQARPPSAAYRFRRFVRRNQTAVGAGSAFVLLLLLAVAGVVWQAIRAQRGEAAATAALAELRASAPAFADQARSLVDKDRFNEALEKLDTAIKLRPDVVDYVLLKANLLQAQLRFAEAADVYRTALQLTPAGQRASANAALCDTLAAEMTAKGKPSRENLAYLASAMEKEGRPTAERIRIERLLGEEKKLLVEYWLKRLKDLSLPPEYPLEKQLTLGENGQLQLALTGTPITDLSPLAGMPLETLILSGSKNIKDLSPLRGMPLRELSLGAMTREGEYYAPCEISDLSALGGLPLKSLNLAKMLVSDLAPLQGVPLETLDLSGTAVRDVAALKGMPLRRLYCNETPALDFSPIIGAPLEVLSLQNSKVSDLSFLRELPIKVLLLDGANEARGFHVLTEMANLELLTLSRWLVQWPDEEMAAIDRLRRSERLRGIQFGPPAWAESGISTREPAEFWREFDDLARMRKATVTVASLARAGRFREAAEVTRAQLAPEGDSTNCMLLCIELAAAGDLKGYRAACDEMLRRFAHPNRADDAERTLRCVLLLPQEGLDKTVLARLTEYVRNEKATAWDELAAGLADYRASRLDSAADWLVRCCARAVISNRCKSAASAVLAMTEYRRGNVDAAKTALASSRSMISAQWPNGDELNWHAWLMADILCREAEALIR